MPLTLVADMAGAERAHTAIKDVMHHPGATGSSAFDVLHDLAAPLRHGLPRLGLTSAVATPLTPSTPHVKERSR